MPIDPHFNIPRHTEVWHCKSMDHHGRISYSLALCWLSRPKPQAPHERSSGEALLKSVFKNSPHRLLSRVLNILHTRRVLMYFLAHLDRNFSKTRYFGLLMHSLKKRVHEAHQSHSRAMHPQRINASLSGRDVYLLKGTCIKKSTPKNLVRKGVWRYLGFVMVWSLHKLIPGNDDGPAY